jgi:hypothetical protein
MSLAGGTSIVLSVAGLTLLGVAWLAVLAILVVLLLGAVFGAKVQLPEGAASAAAEALALGGVVALFASLDVLLLATGISIWRVSRRARSLAVAYALVAVPLGGVDTLLASATPEFRLAAIALALFTPIYALGLLLAFSVIPSWRANLRRLPWKPEAPPSVFSTGSA